MDSLYSKLIEIAGKDSVLCDEDMSKHTTFKAGGKARYYVEPSRIEEISALMKLFHQEQIDYYIVGNGSNLLVKDSGYHGVIIKIGNKLSEVKVNDNIINCCSGVLLSTIANRAVANNLSGLEFAAGIPGTVGGAVAMNAGAYGGEIKDIVSEVTVIDASGMIKKLENKDLQFGYRTSLIQKEELLVLSATFLLNKESDDSIIKEKMAQYMNARREKQPLEFPSAGSTFKRPEGYYAGKLIMDSNLAGYQIGGARVSEKHCGFIVNAGGATATDLLELIKYVQNKVKMDSGVVLETEVKILG